MKRLNIFLIIAFVICFLTVIQIQFQIIYFNPLNYNNGVVEKINILILIFSSGWILSSIFHFVVNILPNEHKRKVTKTIIKELKINDNFPTNYKVKIVRDYGKDRSLGIELIFNEETTEFEFIENLIDKIITNCDYILNLPFIDTVDFNLIKLTTDIKSAEYLNILKSEVDSYSAKREKDDKIEIMIAASYAPIFVDFKKLYNTFRKQIKLTSEAIISKIEIIK